MAEGSTGKDGGGRSEWSHPPEWAQALTGVSYHRCRLLIKDGLSRLNGSQAQALSPCDVFMGPRKKTSSESTLPSHASWAPNSEPKTFHSL